MSSPALPARALCRAVGARYADCLRPGSTPVNVQRAVQQHAAYVTLLERLGVSVEVLPADEDSPDGCFVEDVAVVFGARALITVPGAPERRSEVEPVAAALEPWLELRPMERGTLDGGDVLRVGDTWFVGASGRSDSDGAGVLAEFVGSDVVSVPLRSGLHLKGGATALGDDRVLVDDNAVDPAVFESRGLHVELAPEPAGANVLVFARSALVSSSAPRTAELLERLGFDVHQLELSEIHAGDGALSCLYLRVPHSRSDFGRATWCV